MEQHSEQTQDQARLSIQFGVCSAVVLWLDEQFHWERKPPWYSTEDNVKVMTDFLVAKAQLDTTSRQLVVTAPVWAHSDIPGVSWVKEPRAPKDLYALLRADEEWSAWRKSATTIACDASFFAQGKHGAWGYVRAGERDNPVVEVGDLGSSTEAELRAAIAALESTQPGETVELLMDFKPAVQFINKTSAGQPTKWLDTRRKCNDTLTQLASHLSSLCRQRTVLATWVPGHAGHWLFSSIDQATRKAQRSTRRPWDPDGSPSDNAETATEVPSDR